MTSKFKEKLISEEELLGDMREAEIEHREGRTIKAKSIEELLNFDLKNLED